MRLQLCTFASMKVDISSAEIEDYKKFVIEQLKAGRTIEKAKEMMVLHLKAERHNVVEAITRAIKEFKPHGQVGHF